MTTVTILLEYNVGQGSGVRGVPLYNYEFPLVVSVTAK